MDEFWEQFLGAFTGGLLAIIGVLVAFYLERRARTRESFDQAVEQVMYRLNELAGAADAWHIQMRTSSWAPGDFPPPHPHSGTVSIAIEIARLKAKKQSDQAVLHAISAAWTDIALHCGRTLSVACLLTSSAVVNWRGGDDLSEVRSHLDHARTLGPVPD